MGTEPARIRPHLTALPVPSSGPGQNPRCGGGSVIYGPREDTGPEDDFLNKQGYRVGLQPAGPPGLSLPRFRTEGRAGTRQQRDLCGLKGMGVGRGGLPGRRGLFGYQGNQLRATPLPALRPVQTRAEGGSAGRSALHQGHSEAGPGRSADGQRARGQPS